MDVVKPNQNNSRFSNWQKIILVIFVLLISLIYFAGQSLNHVSVKRSDIIIGSVKNGDLDVVIEGYGTLKSNRQQLLTALTRATVKEIILKPGALVSADSIILKMENPELVQLVENANQQLAQATANLRQLIVNNKRESLNESASLAEINALYQMAKIKRIAEEKLVKAGIVARNDFEESLLNEQQLKNRINILGQRLEQLAEVHLEAINIQQQIIKQQQGQLDIAQERLDKLVVRAGLDGVLHRLSVELGESLSPGQEIGLIGSVKELVAQIKVPQSQAQQIVLGQKTIIDTRQDKIEGQVSRIDPIVENNTVTIEISLPLELTASARPQLNVDGVIIIEQLKQVNYIERPANVKPNTKIDLYRLTENFDKANLVRVSFGKQAGRFIEVVAGAKINEEYILSDMTNLRMIVNEIGVE